MFFYQCQFSGAAIVFQTVRAPSTPAQCPPHLSEGADHDDGGDHGDDDGHHEQRQLFS